MLVLEGGYDTPSLAESVVASLEGLMGLPATSVPPPAARNLYEEPMRKVEGVLMVGPSKAGGIVCGIGRLGCGKVMNRNTGDQ